MLAEKHDVLVIRLNSFHLSELIVQNDQTGLDSVKLSLLLQVTEVESQEVV